MNDPELVKALAKMRGAFPAANATLDTLKLYAEMLSEYDVPAVVAAIDRIIRTSEPKYYGYFPSIAEITATMNTGGSLDGQAELAWIDVTEQIKQAPWRDGTGAGRIFRNGVYLEPRKPVFRHRVTEIAVKSLTWKLICQAENAADVRKQFLWTWKNMASGMVKHAQNNDHGDFALGVPTYDEMGEGDA